MVLSPTASLGQSVISHSPGLGGRQSRPCPGLCELLSGHGASTLTDAGCTASALDALRFRQATEIGDGDDEAAYISRLATR